MHIDRRLDLMAVNNYHRANRNRWNLGSPAWEAMLDRRGTWRIAHRQPEKVFLRQELDLIAGKKVRTSQGRT